MFNGNYELGSEAFKVVEEIGRHMPGGFFIYKAEQPEQILYANKAVFDIFGCRNLAEFKELTGYTFKGMVHPDDYKEISSSINEQIEKSDEGMDYVEYRIVRRDGRIRWVDDYGHFSNTKSHGGVYFVFISDITEKRERINEELREARETEEENKRLMAEVESAAKLAELMGAVSSLLTNMPAMSYSKDALTGKYLACNQSYAAYTHKKTPEEVAGLTDFDIFDQETASHFVADDQKALAMDKPYIFFEDVPDAKGKLRNLQTTKMKFKDATGRICILGMCVDVTEMTRIKSAEAEARIKQQELEEKIALQEKLLEQSETVRQALKAAEEASRAKTNFLSNMSHEIRTPITAILGMNELIRRESQDKNILEYSHSIGAAGTSLLSIINDILDFSKIEAGRMELVEAEYDSRTFIADLANLVKFRLEEKGLLLLLEIDPRMPVRLFGDELRLKQVITNLLSNASKYTEKGTVTLKMQVAQKDDQYVEVEVAVKDTGIGIKEEEIGRLFSAFERLDLIRTRSIEGSGLGLAISSRMLKLMGADLKVQSTYGQGSVFSFIVRQQIVDSSEIGDFDISNTAVIGETVRNHLSFTAPSARVLLVDDTPLNLKVIVGLLKKTQLITETASSGMECIEKFGATDYDIIFLDYRMPDMDGIETLKKLYELYPEKAQATPIVCLTASAIVGDREKMLEAGFDDYLPKPVNILDMERLLIHYLPREKVQLIEEKGIEALPETSANSLMPALFKIEALDPVAGIDCCGSEEDYMETLSVFSASIGSKSAKIEKAWQEQDIKNYTIQVHSLKSMSRIVGANSLAELAFQLEMAGKEANADLIEEKTPRLLELYRSLQEPLDEILEKWEDG